MRKQAYRSHIEEACINGLSTIEYKMLKTLILQAF